MNLSQNFTLAELCKSQTAKRRKFEEQFNPPKEVIENLTLVAVNILEKIRVKFGPFTVSQGYRCQRLNRAVKGARNSEHLTGNAVDIDLGARNKELFDWCKENLDFRQLINEYPDKNGTPDWVHISFNPKDNKKQVLTII